MFDHEAEESRGTYRVGLWSTLAYLLLALAFVKIDAIYGLVRPSGFTDSLAGILAPITVWWGLLAMKSQA